MKGPAVAVENLVKRYGGSTVLDVGRLDFERGGVHVIVGPNGAGKTTLLRALGGIEPPDSGGVRVLGRDLWDLGPRERLSLRRRMAFCAQKPYMFRTTVRRNVDYPLRVRGVPSKERASRAGSAMEKLGVRHLAERSARTLSAGEAQRAALARAAVCESELLFLDEPLANIDPEGVRLVEGLLVELASSGVTLLAATHVIEQAYRLSASVVRLEGGRVAPPAVENLLEGELVEEESGSVLRLKEGVVIDVSTEKRGHARATIDPRDIIVSSETFDSSARNSLKARVSSLKERSGLVYVTADAGVSLTSCITRESCRRLNLTVGSKMYFTFKATAVKIF